MGAINVDNTGSGGAITLSSDGTTLLLGGSAVGGADLYVANESSPDAQPTATGANAIAIGDSAAAPGAQSVAIGRLTDSDGTLSAALGFSATTGSSGSYAVVLGRAYSNNVDGFAAAITNNTSSYGATGPNSVAIGQGAKATGTQSVAIGGQSPTSSSSSSVVIGGYASQATDQQAICIGGLYSLASAYDSLAMGSYAKAAHVGKAARASGQFAAQGDAQGGQFILRENTTDATPSVMATNQYTAGSTNQIIAASDTCITFSGTVVAMQNGAQAYGSWKIEGLLVNDGGTTTVPNSAITVIHNSSSWGLALSADNTNNALKVQVTGEASHNIRWVANIQTAEVTYA